MQEVLSAIVLSSEAKRTAMNDQPAQTQPNSEPCKASDERLMLAFSQGSTEAFTELFTRYKQPLYGFFRRRLGDPARAEELTQETFLVVLRSASRYEPRALFRTYLYAIGFKILRAQRRRSVLRATILGLRKPEQASSLWEAHDANLAVREALGKLDSIEREILLLREFEQLSYSEIADLLRLPVNTVRSRLFRARVTLRDILAAPAPQVAPAKLTESEEHA
jgi:RNA polymerase sigma-70 factor (ECF subfamily)